MCKNSNNSASKCLKIIEEKDKVDDKIRALKKMNESEENFPKNYNLNDYRNKDSHLMYINLKDL